jgi:hypothetical protein
VHADQDVIDLEAAAEEAASKCMLRLVHARTEEREDGFPSPRASPSSLLAASIDDDVDDDCPRLTPQAGRRDVTTYVRGAGNQTASAAIITSPDDMDDNNAAAAAAPLTPPRPAPPYVQV